MDDRMIETLAAVAEPLISIGQAVWPEVRRVYRERQAGQMPFAGGIDLLERGLDETLGRLRGGNVANINTWWQNLLDRIGHQFVAPDFLCKPTLQEWLANEQVQTDFKALARDRIMGAGIDTPEARVRLQQAYANSTGEDERRAHGPIDVVLAILAAGYLSSIDPTLQPIAGMIQASARENRERLEEQFGGVHRRLEVLGPDHYVVQAHSEQAERELNLLCKQRSLAPDKVRRELIALAARVTEGDLRHVKPAIRAEVRYWTARVHATQSETLTVARQYLVQLCEGTPGTDTRIIDALILETEGDIDGALRILRNVDTPDGRATFFRTLSSRRGAETALAWFDDQLERNNVGFLTGIGWWNVAVCLAKMGRWEEASERLATAQIHIHEWPDLAFVKGVVNAACCLPSGNSMHWK
jgi:hypothetical protein